MCYEIETKFDEGIKFCKKYIDFDPYNSNAWHYLGMLYQKKNDFLNAIESYDFSIAINTQDLKSYINKAECLSNEGYYEKAIDTFKSTFKIKKPNALIFKNIAECYEGLDKLDIALAYYHKSINLEKNLADSWYSIALIYNLQDKYFEAIHLCARLKNSNSSTSIKTSFTKFRFGRL